MSQRLSALLIAAVFGGALLAAPAAQAAPAATTTSGAPVASAAATKAKAKKKAKVTLAGVNKRLTRTEKQLKTTRAQLKTTRATLDGLQTAVGGTLDGLLGSDVVGQINAALGGVLGDATGTDQIAGLITSALGKVDGNQLAVLLTTALGGKSPADFLKGITDLSTTVGALTTAYQQSLASSEYPVVVAKIGNGQSQAVIGSDVPDDGNPVTVSASVPVKYTSGGALQLLAGVRSGESDNPAATAKLISAEIVSAVGSVTGGYPGDTDHVVPLEGNGSADVTEKLPLSADPNGGVPALDLISAGGLATTLGTVSNYTFSGAGIAIVRFTVRFTDTTTNLTKPTE